MILIVVLNIVIRYFPYSLVKRDLQSSIKIFSSTPRFFGSVNQTHTHSLRISVLALPPFRPTYSSE